MKRRHIAGIVLALLMIAVLPGNSHARAEWDIKKVLKLNMQPLDVAVPNNGNSIFVLSKSGKVLIYSFDGRLKDEIDVGNHVDRIFAGPSDEWLFLSSRENKTVKIIHIDFIQQIDTSGSPFLGPKNAPIVLVVFSDFQ
ncbi:MAG: hypothetical protein LJE66_05755 [Desulfobacterales bacterium]|nr:hypothetical protein [Desulfobacterales bacterium]